MTNGIHDAEERTDSLARVQPPGELAAFGVTRVRMVIVPLLAVFILVLYLSVCGIHTLCDPPILLAAISAIFLVFIPLCAAFLAGRNYHAVGHPVFFLLGCGLVSFAACSLLTCWSTNTAGAPDIVVALHCLGAGLWHFASSVFLFIAIQNESDMLLGCRCVFIVHAMIMFAAVGLGAFAALSQRPAFCIQGIGFAPLHQWVLGGSAVLCVVSGLHLVFFRARVKTRFAHWYGLSLLLIYIGLAGDLIQKYGDYKLGWVGRSAQYLSGCCLLAALVAGKREVRRDDAGASLSQGWFWPFVEHGILRRTSDRCQQDDALQKEVDARRNAEFKHACAHETALEFQINYLHLFESIGDPIVVHDKGMHILAVNGAACEYYGYTRAELGSMTIYQLDAPDEVVYQPERMAKVEQNGEAVFEVIHRRKDNTFVNVEVHARAMVWRGTPAVIGICRDVTQRKQAEDKLAESQRRLMLATESAKMGIWEWDIAHDRIIWDEQVFRLYGIIERPSTISIAYWISLLHEDDVGSVRAVGKAALKDDAPYSAVYRIRQPNGNIRYIQANGMVIRDESGNPKRMLGIDYDITMQRQAAAILDRNLSILSTAVAQSPIGSLIADHFFRITEANDSACQILGLVPATIVNEDMLGVLLGSGPDNLREISVGGLANEGRWMHLLHVPVHGGSDRWLDIQVISIKGVDGQVVGYAASIRDMTAMKRMEIEHQHRTEEFMQSSRMASLGVLTAGLGHEISNPANFIAINIPLLKTYWNEALPVLDAHAERTSNFTLGRMAWPQVRCLTPSLFDGIEDGLDRIRATLASMRNYAIPDLRSHQPVDMNAVVESSLTLTRHALNRASTKLSVELHPGLPAVLGSFQRLEQVVVNLLLNACQALPSNDRAISIATHLDHEMGRILVVIADEGVGIPAEELPHLGEPFRTTKRNSGGTGLGLSIVKRILAEHGGDLNISSHPDCGTTVTVSMPILPSGVAT